MSDYLAIARRHLAELRGLGTIENDNVQEYEKNEINEKSPTDPPDDPLSNEIRARLLLWGGPLGWPSLVEIGLGVGGEAWTTWLMAASTEDLKQAVLEAVQAEHTTLALDMEALRLWPGSAIVREAE